MTIVTYRLSLLEILLSGGRCTIRNTAAPVEPRAAVSFIDLLYLSVNHMLSRSFSLHIVPFSISPIIASHDSSSESVLPCLTWSRLSAIMASNSSLFISSKAFGTALTAAFDVLAPIISATFLLSIITNCNAVHNTSSHKNGTPSACYCKTAASI